MRVNALMTRDVVTVSMDDSLEWIRQIFDRHRFHHLVVTENGQIVGVISDRELLKSISPFVGRLDERSQDRNSLKRRAHQIMTRRLICVGEDTPVNEAMGTMLDERVSCLPVVDARRRCVGILTWRDLLGYASDVLGTGEGLFDHVDEAA